MPSQTNSGAQETEMTHPIEDVTIENWRRGLFEAEGLLRVVRRYFSRHSRTGTWDPQDSIRLEKLLIISSGEIHRISTRLSELKPDLQEPNWGKFSDFNVADINPVPGRGLFDPNLAPLAPEERPAELCSGEIAFRPSPKEKDNEDREEDSEGADTDYSEDNFADRSGDYSEDYSEDTEEDYAEHSEEDFSDGVPPKKSSKRFSKDPTKK